MPSWRALALKVQIQSPEPEDRHVWQYPQLVSHCVVSITFSTPVHDSPESRLRNSPPSTSHKFPHPQVGRRGCNARAYGLRTSCLPSGAHAPRPDCCEGVAYTRYIRLDRPALPKKDLAICPSPSESQRTDFLCPT